jgi:hypothetical protein
VARVKPADETLAGAVAESVEHLELTPADGAAARLAMVYAESIDAGVDRERLGPALLRCLEQLGATPRARAEIGRRVHGEVVESALERLRATRRPS